MPGKPKLETLKTKAGNTAYHAVATYRDMAFLTIYGEKYEKKSGDREALLETVVKSFIEGKKVASSKKEMIGGYPARRVVLEDDDKDKFEARIVIADDRLIQTIFIGPTGNALGTQVSRLARRDRSEVTPRLSFLSQNQSGGEIASRIDWMRNDPVRKIALEEDRFQRLTAGSRCVQPSRTAPDLCRGCRRSVIPAAGCPRTRWTEILSESIAAAARR